MLILIISYVLELPERINNALSEYPVMRESWLDATAWTGFYSSTPEGIVNIGELGFTDESDVVIFLEYSEHNHSIDGYMYTRLICERGHFYRNILLRASPSI